MYTLLTIEDPIVYQAYATIIAKAIKSIYKKVFLVIYMPLKIVSSSVNLGKYVFNANKNRVRGLSILERVHRLDDNIEIINHINDSLPDEESTDKANCNMAYFLFVTPSFRERGFWLYLVLV